jgi:hypothetical protein
MRYIALALVFLFASAATPPRYLVTWAMESNGKSNLADGTGHDFLAVYDIDSAHFGELVAMLPVPTKAHMAHHANYIMPFDKLLFANDFMEGRSYVFDLRDARNPRIAGTFTDAGPYTHPHSFYTLPNGDTLATFQDRGQGDSVAGALVELDRAGHVVRSSDASAPQADTFIRPYSLEVLANFDRVVTTSADMMPSPNASHVVQVWRLSNLKLLKTIVLPKPLIFGGVDGQDSDEARVLSDGETVLVKTGTCGLFRLTGLAGTDPVAEFVYDFGYRACASVPVVIGHYWLQASLSGHTVTVLDVRDPSHPVEASRLYLGPEARPHWMAREPGTDRIVITGFGSLLNKIEFATLDERTGELVLDSRAITLDRTKWPDGWKGRAIPHATLFY